MTFDFTTGHRAIPQSTIEEARKINDEFQLKRPYARQKILRLTSISEEVF